LSIGVTLIKLFSSLPTL